MPFARVYPLYIQKAEKKGRTKAEVDAVIGWLTGYTGAKLKRAIDTNVSFEDFFAAAQMHANTSLIAGVVCGVRVEDVEDPLMQKIRYSTSSSTSSRAERRWRRSCAHRRAP